MKKIISILLVLTALGFGQSLQTDNGTVTVNQTSSCTEKTLYPSVSLEGIGMVESLAMYDCGGFKMIEIKYDGRTQSISVEDNKTPVVTIQTADRFLSWENITKKKFEKSWKSYSKLFKDVNI
jgi:hypothetical protein